jgi:hypothetical protein
MPLETVVFSPPIAQLQRRLTPARWWAAIERNAPRVLVPTAARLKTTAPRGKSGKLSRGFDVRAKPVRQGLVQGVQAEIGARVRYGHLVSRGHQIIARGATRFTFSGTARKAIPGRAVLAAERSKLKARRAAGAIGFVAGDPFVEQAVAADRANIIRLSEKLLEQEVGRAV